MTCPGRTGDAPCEYSDRPFSPLCGHLKLQPGRSGRWMCTRRLYVTAERPNGAKATAVATADLAVGHANAVEDMLQQYISETTHGLVAFLWWIERAPTTALTDDERAERARWLASVDVLCLGITQSSDGAPVAGPAVAGAESHPALRRLLRTCRAESLAIR